MARFAQGTAEQPPPLPGRNEHDAAIAVAMHKADLEGNGLEWQGHGGGPAASFLE